MMNQLKSKSKVSLKLSSSNSLLLNLAMVALLLERCTEVDSNKSPGDGGPTNVEKEPENLIHPPCTACQENEFYELENSFDLFPPGHCFGMTMPSTLTIQGLAMKPKDWWHAQVQCQQFGGYLYEPLAGTNDLEHMKRLASAAHGVTCPMKRRKSYQEYWTGLHFQPEFFNQIDQPELIGASTGLDLPSDIEYEEIFLDYFYGSNPNRNKSATHPVYDSCVEMSSSTHQDSLLTHGRLNDDDCWAQNLPLCTFSYVGTC